MKFNSPTRLISKKPNAPDVSPPGLKPLVLVNRLNDAKLSTPAVKKKRGNHGTRLLRLLGLKKKKKGKSDVPRTDYVLIEKSPSKAGPPPSKAPFVVPLRYSPLESCGRPVSHAPSRPMVRAVRQDPTREATGRHLPGTASTAQLAPRALLLRPSSTFLTSASLVPLQGRPAKPSRNPLTSIPRTARQEISAVRPGSPSSPLPEWPPLVAPAPSSAPQISSPPIDAPKRRSRIPRYVGRSKAFINPSPCVLCGSLKPTPFRNLSAVSTQTVASESCTTPPATSSPSPESTLPPIQNKQTVDFAVQTEAEEPRLLVDFGTQTNSEEHRPLDERYPVSVHSSLEVSSRPSQSPKAAIRRGASGLIAAIKTKQASAPATKKQSVLPTNTSPRAPSLPSTFRTKHTSAVLDELRDRFAGGKSLTPTPPRQDRPTPSPYTFAGLRTQRTVAKENPEGEEGELFKVFRRRNNGVNGSARVPLGPVDINTNASSSSEQPGGSHGTRKLRRIIVPPVTEGSVPSRDPRILSELDRLRAQAKVGGGMGATYTQNRKAEEKDRRCSIPEKHLNTFGE